MVAIFALLLQALLPLSFLTSASYAAGSTSTAAAGWSMGPLCTAVHGTAGADEVPAPPGQVPLHASCPLCIGLHLAAVYLPPTTAAIAMPRVRALAPRHRDIAVDRPTDRRSASRARAPPSLP